eukprot:CAMPEP_0201593934 /NCGR_PEP_ID=MMETSP0190_2-20130828/191410_1 /ASSEMBLY_ACC=CAM_ASM_000263 /TAXON_ID=37353 /ORGANISM="Rosalina sp." /LENGTH=314 /DNA_ID=CAMNT_0048053357 /DNA_START=384 /DNA_END=1328 /DNA_ORIENTATION=-
MDESAVSGLDENYAKSAHHAEYELQSAKAGYATIQSGASLPFPIETSSGIAYVYAYFNNDGRPVSIANGQPVNGESHEITTNDDKMSAMVSPVVTKDKEWRNILKEKGFSQSIIDKMQQDGWDDMKYWKQIDVTIMTADLGFKPGHVAKWKGMMEELYPPEPEAKPEPKPEPEPVDPFVGTWMFQCVISGKFIHQKKGVDKLMQWNKEGGDNQIFEVKSMNKDWYTIKVKRTGKYWSIDGKSHSNGAKLMEYTYHGDFDQQYRFVWGGYGVYGIQVRHSEKWLYVEDMGKHNGGKINQGEWKEAYNYRWRMVKV